MADYTVTMVPAHPGARTKPSWLATQCVVLARENPEMSREDIAGILVEQHGQPCNAKTVAGHVEAFDRWCRTTTEQVARKVTHREREQKRQAALVQRREAGERVLGEVRGAPSAPENCAQSSPRAIV